MRKINIILIFVLAFSLIATMGAQVFAADEHQLVLGENTVLTSNQIYSFTPTESGMYIFKSSCDGDPYACLCNENGEEEDRFDDSSDLNFAFTIEAYVGEIYYFTFGEYNSASEYTVNISSHTHSSDVQTCKGYLCSGCNNYYGNAGDHRPGEQTCQGYICLDCSEYFGEAGDEHNLDEQTCKGYRCKDCYNYFGEGNNYHPDGNDSFNNVCDTCNTYFGPNDFTTGERTVRYEDYYGAYLLRFIPEKSGVYIISSHATEESGIDPLVYVYRHNEDGYLQYYEAGDNENGKNFFVELNLVAGEPYYFVFYSENQYEQYTINFYLDTHIHSGGEQNCKGYLCTCGEYYGDKGDHTPTGEMTCLGTLCSVCEEYFGDVLEHNKVGEITCSGYYCDTCKKYQGEGDETKHAWDSNYGWCRICEEYCQHGEYDNGGKCLECSYQMDYMVTSGDTVAFYISLSDAVLEAEEGSIIKLLRDTIEGAVYFNKKLTFDLAGYTIDTPSSDNFWIYDEVVFTDSVGGGYLGIYLNLSSPVIFDGGSYRGAGIEFNTDNVIADYLPSCYKMMDYYDKTFIDVSSAVVVVSFTVVLSHQAGDATCLGQFCEDCGESVGEADPDAHKLSEQTCTTPKTCSACGKTEGDALGHRWQDATVEAPKTCETCGATEGNKLPAEDTTNEPELEKNHDECEVNWFNKLLNLIMNFFRKLFGKPEKCTCGEKV